MQVVLIMSSDSFEEDFQPLQRQQFKLTRKRKRRSDSSDDFQAVRKCHGTSTTCLHSSPEEDSNEQVVTQSSRSLVEVDNVVSVQSDGAILVKSGVHQQLDAREVHNFLKYAATKYINVISSAPPVQPPGGTVFLYDLGADETNWNALKRKMR